MRSLLTLLRHLTAVAVLPFMVVVVAPRWLLARWPSSSPFAIGASPLIWLERGLGIVLLACGFALFLWCVTLFARIGGGTLAPWDPTRHLVAAGPYGHVRNPMISSVLMMLSGEALLWRSWAVAVWSLTFFLINQVYFVASEEPGLARRLGDPYERYRANVPRWLPRWTRWKP